MINSQTKREKKTRKKTSIAIDPELWQQFGREIQRKGTSQADAIELLVKDFIENVRSQPARVTKKRRASAPTRADLHEWLDVILDSGIPLAIDAIVGDLRVNAFFVRELTQLASQNHRKP